MSERIAFFSALYDALRADATLRDVIQASRGTPLADVPIYADRAPPDEASPYLTYNEVSDDAWDTADTFGVEIVADVHAWSEATSRLEAENLIARVRVLTRDPVWTLSGYRLVYCRPLRARVDADGEYFHGVCTVRALVGHL